MFIKRNQNNEIEGMFTNAQPHLEPPVTEWLDDDNVEVQEFIKRSSQSFMNKWEIERKKPIEWQLDENGVIVLDEAGFKVKAGGGYGALEQQLEILGEQGITKFRMHISEVKSRIPKT